MILRLNYIKITEKQKEVISKSYTKTFKFFVKKMLSKQKTNNSQSTIKLYKQDSQMFFKNINY